MRILLLQDEEDLAYYTGTGERWTLGDMFEKIGRPHTDAFTVLVVNKANLPFGSDEREAFKTVDYKHWSNRPTGEGGGVKYGLAFDTLWNIAEEIE